MTPFSLDQIVAAGMHDKHWYERCEQLLVEMYGRERLPLVADILAATSMKTSLKGNITLFRRALHEIEKGLPFSSYLPAMRQQLDLIRAGEPLSGRKIRAFAGAIKGDIEAVVVDRWLLRAMGYRRPGEPDLSPTDREFDEIEQEVRWLAKYWYTMSPRQLSAVLWSGVRILWSNDRETNYHNVLRHQLYNMFENGN
jgi:hypothetical protein